jgi:hypothetical protein
LRWPIYRTDRLSLALAVAAVMALGGARTEAPKFQMLFI